MRARGVDERSAASAAGAARSTVRRWQASRDALVAGGASAQFFESPEGGACLRRVVLAMAFVIGLLCPGGIRLVCLFLQLSGLDDFVGSSVGAAQSLTADIEKHVVQFGREQRALLAKTMSPKEITVCEDETFHPQVCLVASEPVSNFILAEEYTADRKTETWNDTMTRALAGLQVKVVQGTSDEAKALLAHVADGLGAHHSPDLFHAQRSASQATSLPLFRRIRQGEKALEDAMRATEQVRLNQEAYAEAKHGPGRPPDLAGRLSAACEIEAAAKKGLDQANADRDQARAAIARLSETYHPYARSDGRARSAEEAGAGFEEIFGDLEAIAERAGLPDKSHKDLAKARRVSKLMVETIRWVHGEITKRLSGLGLEEGSRREVEERMVPGLYLEITARKAGTADKRRTIEEAARALLAPLRADGHPLTRLTAEQQSATWRTAKECAQLFQRSSSCVEGRNGHLSLHHHGAHKLSAQKLEALTVVHNFFARRPDGTTAAERFFDAPHADLFEALLMRVRPLARPGSPRASRPRRSASVGDAAANRPVGRISP